MLLRLRRTCAAATGIAALTAVAAAAPVAAETTAGGGDAEIVRVVDQRRDVTTQNRPKRVKHPLDIYRFRAFTEGPNTVLVMKVRNLTKRNTEDVMLDGGWETMRANFEYSLYADGSSKPVFTIRNMTWRQADLRDHNDDSVFCQQDNQQAYAGQAQYDLAAETIRYTFATSCFGEHDALRVSAYTSTLDGGYASDGTIRSSTTLALD